MDQAVQFLNMYSYLSSLTIVKIYIFFLIKMQHVNNAAQKN